MNVVTIIRFGCSIFECMYFSATFKKMLVQKRKEQLKEFEKQEKRIKDMKQSGKSSKAAVSQ